MIKARAVAAVHFPLVIDHPAHGIGCQRRDVGLERSARCAGIRLAFERCQFRCGIDFGLIHPALHGQDGDHRNNADRHLAVEPARQFPGKEISHGGGGSDILSGVSPFAAAHILLRLRDLVGFSAAIRGDKTDHRILAAVCRRVFALGGAAHVHAHVRLSARNPYLPDHDIFEGARQIPGFDHQPPALAGGQRGQVHPPAAGVSRRHGFAPGQLRFTVIQRHGHRRARFGAAPHRHGHLPLQNHVVPEHARQPEGSLRPGRRREVQEECRCGNRFFEETHSAGGWVHFTSLRKGFCRVYL